MSSPTTLTSSSSSSSNPLRSEATSPSKRSVTFGGRKYLEEANSDHETSSEYLASALAFMHLASPEKEERIFPMDDVEKSPDYKLKRSRPKQERIATKSSKEDSRKAPKKSLFKEYK